MKKLLIIAVLVSGVVWITLNSTKERKPDDVIKIINSVNDLSKEDYYTTLGCSPDRGCGQAFYFDPYSCVVKESWTMQNNGGRYQISTTTAEALKLKEQLSREIPTCLEWQEEMQARRDKEEAEQIEKMCKTGEYFTYDDYKKCKDKLK